jgi:hypothetical protein
VARVLLKYSALLSSPSPACREPLGIFVLH